LEKNWAKNLNKLVMLFKSELIKTLYERGFISNATNYEELDKTFLNTKNTPVYIGFDCTASSLHIGSLVQIMILAWVQKLGHKPIVLMGGGTTKIGDPSGKDESRKILSQENIEQNKAGLKKVFSKYLQFEEKFNPKTSNSIMVDNADWLDSLNYIDFLRTVGRHFSVNKMLSLESVKNRLEREHHLSFLEFNYVLLQAYDFVILSEKYNCKLQFGGSDQWGNIVNGIELERKMKVEEAKPSNNLLGATTPLLTTASGKKMGKTQDGAVWLDEELISPYDFWQYWRNVEDADTTKFLKLFTFLPLEKIEDIKDINQAKVLLATEITAKCFGEEKALQAKETAFQLFVGGNFAGDDLPTFNFSYREAENLPLSQLLVQINAETSNGNAKKLIKGGGVKINEEKILDEFYKISSSDIVDKQIRISVGKKKHYLVKIS
jgi:tyrosyl-tRNA synthetase